MRVRRRLRQLEGSQCQTPTLTVRPVKSRGASLKASQQPIDIGDSG
jgi:hypothetical protein